jgi:hypothetical protein
MLGWSGCTVSVNQEVKWKFLLVVEIPRYWRPK